MQAFYKFEYGYLKIGYTETTVILLNRTESIESENIASELSDSVYIQIREYLDGKRKAFNFPIDPQGTDFQKAVWNALLAVPYGKTRTYAQIATDIGNPKACRAVGLACGKNPIWISVPCHRIIGASGKLTGYAGGLEMKERLLKLERSYEYYSKEFSSLVYY